MSRPWSGPDRVHRRPTDSSRPSDETQEGGTVSIGTAVDKMLRERGMEDAIVLGRVTSCWEEIVGPEIARQVRPQLVRDDELVVSVDHPAWATELELAGVAVLGRLSEALGDMAPRRLSVRVDPGPRR